MVKVYENSEERQYDEIVTVGIYGDEVGNIYNYDIRNFINTCKRYNIKVTNFKTFNDEDSWEMDLTGNALTIYKLVNYRLPGYHTRSFDEFINQYEI